MSEALVKSEDIKQLADEIVTIIAERTFNSNMEKAEMLYEVGQAVTDKPYYKKGTPAARQIIRDLAYAVGKSERWVYLAVQFAEKYPDFATALQTLDPKKKGLTTRLIAQSLPPPKQACSHEQTREEVWVITRELCRSCGEKINEERVKQ